MDASVGRQSSEGDERARLFVALDLPSPVREALAQWRAGVLDEIRRVRPVPAGDLHVTLCFLGSQPAVEIDSILHACGVLSEMAVAELRLGSSVWLPRSRPRLLAVELEDPDRALAEAQSALASALTAGGWFEPERRPFLAHVTVARTSRGDRVRTSRPPPLPAITFRGSSVVLYRSRLGDGGARYEPLGTVELGGGDEPPSDGMRH